MTTRYDNPYIDIEIEGKSLDEVLDAIHKAREGYGPMWWPELRLLAGRLREPFDNPAWRDDDDNKEPMFIQEIPAGATLFGVRVV